MLGVFSANINMSIGIIGRIKTSEKKTDEQVVSVCQIYKWRTLTHQLFVFCGVFLRGKEKEKGTKSRFEKNPIFVVIFLDFCFLKLEIEKTKHSSFTLVFKVDIV